jgi:hypothetical protein
MVHKLKKYMTLLETGAIFSFTLNYSSFKPSNNQDHLFCFLNNVKIYNLNNMLILNNEFGYVNIYVNTNVHALLHDS